MTADMNNASRRKSNVRLLLILLSVAAVFFAGILVKTWIWGR